MPIDSAILEKPKKVKGSAAGQYLGFAIQPVRMFYHLLCCAPDARVGLEYVDDVSTHNADGTHILEQCKSALSQNPASNWAVDLWKTFANWVENTKSGVIAPDCTKFRLYIVPAKALKPTHFATRLSETKSDAEIKELITDIREARKKLKNVPGCESYLKIVLGADEKILKTIVKNFELVSTDADPLTAIRKHLDASIRPSLVDTVIKWGIGEAKIQVERRISEGQTPLLSAADFRRAFRAFIAAHDNARYLHSLAEEPSTEMVQELMAQAPIFLQQLDVIEAGREIKIRATSDFLRASSDKTKWAEQGYIFEDSLVGYDDGLRIRYLNISTELKITTGHHTEVDQGRLLYARCCQGPSEQLEGRSVPMHFLTGNLNNMANRLEIGWHPKFKDIFDRGE